MRFPGAALLFLFLTAAQTPAPGALSRAPQPLGDPLDPFRRPERPLTLALRYDLPALKLPGEIQTRKGSDPEEEARGQLRRFLLEGECPLWQGAYPGYPPSAYFSVTPQFLVLIGARGEISFPLGQGKLVTLHSPELGRLTFHGGEAAPSSLYLKLGDRSPLNLSQGFRDLVGEGEGKRGKVRCYSSGCELELSFPGRHSSPFSLEFRLSSGVPERVDRKGNLLLRGEGWQIVLPPARAFAQEEELKVRYEIQGQGFRLSLPNPPTTSWELVIPLPPPDQAPQGYPRAFTYEARGESAMLLDYPYGTNGDHDLLTFKLPSGGLLPRFLTILGGKGDEESANLARDPQGGLVLVGRTNSPDFPVTPGAYDPRCGSDGICNRTGTGKEKGDGFVVRLSPRGELLYSTYLGGGEEDLASGVWVGSEGILVAGATLSGDFPTTPRAYSRQCGGEGRCSSSKGAPAHDAFLTRFSLDGKLLYSTFLGGSGEDRAMGVAVDPRGNLIVVGSTQSPDFPVTPGAFKGNCGSDGFCDGGKSDGFVVKLSPDGERLLYSTFLGGEGEDTVEEVSLTREGKLLLLGITRSAGFPSEGVRQGRGVEDWQVFKLSLLPLYPLVVELQGEGVLTSNPSGLLCKLQRCEGFFAEGTIVELIPIKGRGARFLGWSGAPSCKEGKIRMGEPVRCLARFEVPSSRLVVEIQGEGKGRVRSLPEGLLCPPRCHLEVPGGTLVTLVPEPEGTSEFQGFSGDPECREGRVIVEGERHCLAIFRKKPE